MTIILALMLIGGEKAAVDVGALYWIAYSETESR
jgi:hypothetical protein